MLEGDVFARLADVRRESVHAIVTSPPYWGLRDYGVAGQIGLETTLAEYLAVMRRLGHALRRVLHPEGSLWLNLGDCYANDGKWGGETGGMQSYLDDASRRRAGRERRRSGLKPKDLMGIPWRVAFALQARGWWLREDVIWQKQNPMPESVRDRCTRAHEYLFHLTRSASYYHDPAAIAEPAISGPPEATPVSGWMTGPGPHDTVAHNAGSNRERYDRSRAKYLADGVDGESRGRKMLVNTVAARARGGDHDSPFGPTRNKRSVWTLATMPYPEAHFATFPESLVEPCILASTPRGALVLDPFAGSGTVGAVAKRLGRQFVGIELNPEYCALARRRIAAAACEQLPMALPAPAPAPAPPPAQLGLEV